MTRFTLDTNPKMLALPEEAHPYGKGNRPGTPVGDVVSNYYGQQAANEITKKYDYLGSTRASGYGRYSRGHTRASAMAHNYVHHENFVKS